MAVCLRSAIPPILLTARYEGLPQLLNVTQDFNVLCQVFVSDGGASNKQILDAGLWILDKAKRAALIYPASSILHPVSGLLPTVAIPTSVHRQ